MAQTIQSSDLGNDNQSQMNQQQNNQQNQAGGQGDTASNSNSQQNNGYQQQTGQPSGGQQNANKQQGSGYTNIQKVLGANQGNKLGQAVGSGIQGQTQQAGQQLGQSQQNFQNQTNQNQFNTDANNQLVTNVLGNAAQYAPTGTNDPNAQAGAKFQQLISGQYQGPMALDNSQQLQSQAQNVGQLGAATGSVAGQMGLLQQFVGGPQYTQGQQKLDQTLLGQTGGQDIANARRAALQLQGQTSGALSGAQEVGKQQTNQATQFGQGVQDQFGNTVSTADTGLQTQAKQLQDARDAQYKKTVSDLQGGSVSQSEANLLGLTQGQQVTNDFLKNAGSYVTENANKANQQNVASAADYAKMQALQKLGGSFTPSGAANTLGQYTDPTKAGSFQAEKGVTADSAGLNAANAAQLAQYHSQLDPVQEQMRQGNEIYQLMEARNRGGPGSDSGQQAQRQLEQKYAGALQGDSGQQTGWAIANRQTANTNYQNIMNALNAQYGGLGNINITPDQTVTTDNK
jgi:hypothetical protein